MGEILEIARAAGLFVVEDAAESLGSRYHGRPSGSHGDIACFSFYGNKLITTGEGGACVTANPVLHERMSFLRDHGMNKKKRYWHDEVGFNYRDHQPAGGDRPGPDGADRRAAGGQAAQRRALPRRPRRAGARDVGRAARPIQLVLDVQRRPARTRVDRAELMRALEERGHRHPLRFLPASPNASLPAFRPARAAASRSRTGFRRAASACPRPPPCGPTRSKGSACALRGLLGESCVGDREIRAHYDELSAAYQRDRNHRFFGRKRRQIPRAARPPAGPHARGRLRHRRLRRRAAGPRHRRPRRRFFAADVRGGQGHLPGRRLRRPGARAAGADPLRRLRRRHGISTGSSTASRWSTRGKVFPTRAR